MSKYLNEFLVRGGQHGVDKGLLLEEDEPVEGGEEDDGQEHVREISCRGNQELGQAAQVNCHLPRPVARGGTVLSNVLWRERYRFSLTELASKGAAEWSGFL